MDTLSKENRSRLMAAIKSKNTKPELIIRNTVSYLGNRYRLNAAGLPGKQDLVFRKKAKAIIVHGSFWHCHEGCKNHRLPKSRIHFWKEKLFSNKRRDRLNIKAFQSLGISVKVVWECQTADLTGLKLGLQGFQA